MVRLLNLQVITRAQRVHQPLLPIHISDLFILLLPQSQHIGPRFGQYKKVIRLQTEPGDFRLPELVTLMPVLDEICGQVDDNHIESIDPNAFEGNNDEINA